MYPNWHKKIFFDGKVFDLSSKIKGLEEKILQIFSQKNMICAIFCMQDLNFISAYYTLFKNDITPLVLKFHPSPEQLAELDADFILTDQSGEIKIEPLYKKGNHSYLNIPDCQVILQTSGSTGEPKHVSWSAKGVQYQSEATSKILQYHSNDCLAILMPLFTAYSLSLIHIAFHNNLPLCLSSSLNPAHFLSILKSSQATTLDALPGLYVDILKYLHENPSFKQELNSIRAWNCGGDILDQNLAIKWQTFMNMPLLDGYGLSEAGPNVAVNGPHQYRFGSVGKALEGTLLKLSKEGELLVKSPSIIKNYLKGSKLKINEDGWLHTGDTATIDEDGYVIIAGRK